MRRWLFVFLLLARPALGEAFFCGNALSGILAAAPFVRVMDPLGQIDREKPLAILLADAATQTRLQFLKGRLETTRQHMHILLGRHDTRIYRVGQTADAAAITVEFTDWQDEHPDVVLYGAVHEATMTLLEDSPSYQEFLSETLATVLESFSARVAEWKQGSEEDRKDAEVLAAELSNVAHVRWQIVQTFRLRNTWMAKMKFYRTELAAHPVLAQGSAATVRELSALEDAMFDTPFRTAAHVAAYAHFETTFRQAFSAFYGANDRYRLTPAVVRAAWNAPQPRLLESSIVVPELLLDKKLFP